MDVGRRLDEEGLARVGHEPEGTGDQPEGSKASNEPPGYWHQPEGEGYEPSSSQVSVQAMGWVLEYSESELAARLVLISIANHASARGSNAFMSVATLAREAHISERQVQRTIATLEALGELIVWKGGGPTVRGGRLTRYEMPKVPGWELPEGCPEHVSGDNPSPLENPKGATSANGKGRHPVPKEVTSDAIAPYVEPREPKTRNPAASGGEVLLRSVFENENIAALQALSGGALEPGPQLLAAMAAGGWSSPTEVPDMPSAIDAYLSSLPTGSYVERREYDKLARQAVKIGKTPYQFLANLCTTNTPTPRAMDLAANRMARADLPGMSGMRSSGVGKREASANEGDKLYQQRKAARAKDRTRNVIDAESEEVMP